MRRVILNFNVDVNESAFHKVRSEMQQSHNMFEIEDVQVVITGRRADYQGFEAGE